MKKVSITLTVIAFAVLICAKTANGLCVLQDSIPITESETDIKAPGQNHRTETQTIPLSAGWSGISSYLNPSNPDVALLMAAIEDQLVILRDYDGNYYQPGSKSPLTDWDFTKGYFIKMSSSETLEIEGLYPLSKQLDLQTGWNLIPVLHDVPVTIENYFAGNLSDVEVVTEVAGFGIYWPAMGIYTINDLLPGKAYLVKADVSFSLFEMPEVTTAPVTDITATSAVSGGEVVSQGSSVVTARG